LAWTSCPLGGARFLITVTPIHLGQRDIHDHEIEFFPRREIEGLLAVTRGNHVVAAVLQHLGVHVPCVVVVLHQEDPRRRGSHRTLLRPQGVRAVFFFPTREIRTHGSLTTPRPRSEPHHPTRGSRAQRRPEDERSRSGRPHLRMNRSALLVAPATSTESEGSRCGSR
jgi:hypothetical protein